MYSQAVFALEEVLLITPNAWNVSSHPIASVLHTQSLTKYRCMLGWAKSCTWRLRATKAVQTRVFRNQRDDFVEVLNYVTIIYVVIMV